MKSMHCTHLIFIPNSGFYFGRVVGSYIRYFSRTFSDKRLFLRDWQRIASWMNAEITELPVDEQKTIVEDEVMHEYAGCDESTWDMGRN